MAAFARARGIGVSRLYWWNKRLTAPPISTMTLVPAAVIADEATAAFPSDVAVVIRVAGGIEIEAARASASWVAAVVAALARSAP